MQLIITLVSAILVVLNFLNNNTPPPPQKKSIFNYWIKNELGKGGP